MNDNTATLGALLFTAGGGSGPRQDSLVSESRLVVYLNHQQYAILPCTPSHVLLLAAGRLASDGLIASAADIASLREANGGRTVFVTLSSTAPSVPVPVPPARPKSADTPDLTAPPQPSAIPPERIFALAQAFARDSELHTRTSATHACYLSCGDELVFTAEDISRHNAVDKAIGYILLNNLPRNDCLLFTTGRVPLDLVTKLARTGLPALASKSVPTAQAVSFARDHGLRLFCRAWPDSFEQYS